MIELNNHKLVDFNSLIHNVWPDEYISYKCKKCNNIIFYCIETKTYFIFINGLDYSSYMKNWIYLPNISCEELMIKRLLE